MAKSKDHTLIWLYLLTFQAAAICIVQATLGFMSGSLELLSDLPHSTIDMVTYGFNAVTEWMKVYSVVTGLRFLQAHVIDEVGSFISVSILLVMMAFAISNILQAINDPSQQIQAINDSRGPIMVFFSLLTLGSNGALLWLYRHWGLSFTDTTSQATADEQAELVKEGHALAKDQCHQCDDQCDDAKEAKEKEWTAVQWIHGLLHPGCRGRICNDLESLQSAKDDAMVNLNLGAAMLHLVTDVLRTLTVLVSGLIIGVHQESAWAIDAYGALLIAAFNILGAGTLGIKALKALINNTQAT